jgi:hypothetical protein
VTDGTLTGTTVADGRRLLSRGEPLLAVDSDTLGDCCDADAGRAIDADVGDGNGLPACPNTPVLCMDGIQHQSLSLSCSMKGEGS